jgi:hypothetical protein
LLILYIPQQTVFSIFSSASAFFPTSSLFSMLSASRKPFVYIFLTSEKDTLELA